MIIKYFSAVFRFSQAFFNMIYGQITIEIIQNIFSGLVEAECILSLKIKTDETIEEP